MTRSVPPRTSVVANVCLRTWAVVSSSRRAAVAMPVMMSWAPLRRAVGRAKTSSGPIVRL
jgi:hypothetical protein